MSILKGLYIIILIPVCLVITLALIDKQNKYYEKKIDHLTNEKAIKEAKGSYQNNVIQTQEEHLASEQIIEEVQQSCKNNVIKTQEQKEPNVEESDFAVLGTTVKDKKHYFIVKDKNTEKIHLQKTTKYNFDNYLCENKQSQKGR